jgi:hypothetical protein
MKKELTFAEQYWTYANEKLDQCEKLWGSIDERKETWEVTIQKEGWLTFQITPEMTYWEYVEKTEHITEPDWNKVEEIEKKWKTGEFDGDKQQYKADFWQAPDFKYWHNADLWNKIVGDVPKDAKALDMFKKFKRKRKGEDWKSWAEGIWQEGDEMWKWSTPDSFWQALCGRGGYAIIRNGKVIESIITIEN